MRVMTAAAEAAALAPVVRLCTAVVLTLDSETVRVCAADWNLVWAGHTYLGVGRLGSISAVQETTTLQANGVRMTMSGILPASVARVLDEPYQGRPVDLYLFFLDDAYAVIADPVLMWRGLIDQMVLTLGQTATIALTANDKLIRWETPSIHRYADADQQARFPGDLGLQFVSQAVEKEVMWGRRL